MISEADKLNQLNKVLTSRSFEKSPTSSRLLAFLANSTLEKKQLKETTVGIELFGQSFINDPSTSRIRVNIYNLRKKLANYYQNEGKNDPIKIIIDKGQYYTQFIQNEGSKTKTPDFKKQYQIAKTLCIAFAFGLLITATLHLYSPSLPIWQSFFNNDKETIVYVGDFFGIMGKTVTGKVGWNRDYEINSLMDFYELKKNNPDLSDQVNPSEYTYMTGMGAVGIQHLTRLFTEHNQNFSIRFSNKSSYEDIKEHNTIYIGPLKNKNKFLSLFNERNTRINIDENQIIYTDTNNSKDILINLLSKEKDAEYAIVARLKGSDDTEQFFFFSDHDMGVMATVDYFSNPKSLKSFKDTHLDNADSFSALFYVTGRERTNLDLELVFVDTHITP